MSISLQTIYSPQSFALPVGGTTFRTLYSCTGIAAFYYPGTANPTHDTLTFALVDSTGKPLTIPVDETLESVTVSASLNSIGAASGNNLTNILWAADTVSVAMNENNRQMILTASLATDQSCAIWRVAYQVMFVTVEASAK